MMFLLVFSVLVLFLGFACLFATYTAIGNKKGSKVHNVLRDVGLVCCFAGIVSFFFLYYSHVQDVKRRDHFLKEVRMLGSTDPKTTTGTAFSNWGLNKYISDSIKTFILDEPLLYHNVKVDGVFTHDKTHSEKHCLIGDLKISYVVENRSAVKVTYPVTFYYVEIAGGCAGVKIEKLEITDRKGNNYLSKEIAKFHQLKSSNSSFSFNERITIPPRVKIRVNMKTVVGVKTQDRFMQRVRYPTISMNVRMSFPANLIVMREYYHPARNLPESERGKIVSDGFKDGVHFIEIKGGLLPYQSLEFYWRKKPPSKGKKEVPIPQPPPGKVPKSR